MDGYGFSDGMSILALSQADLDRELDAVAATGATWLRVPFNWAVVEKTQGSYYWTANDRVVAAAQARGLSVLGVVSYAPTWARSSSASTAPPTDPAAFGDFAGSVATRYASRISSWEIWNEPNIGAGFGGQADVVKYVSLLKAAYQAIKSAQPASTVMSGGLSRGGASFGGLSSYTTAMYAAGAAGYFDALAVHPYLRAKTMRGLALDKTRLVADLGATYLAMVKHGDAAKKIWFTEFGSSTYTGGVSQQQQADLVEQQLAMASSLPFVGPAILYTIRDNGPDKSDIAQNFGTLLTYDWQPKIAAGVLAD
jgi:hypothetical protein